VGVGWENYKEIHKRNFQNVPKDKYVNAFLSFLEKWNAEEHFEIIKGKKLATGKKEKDIISCKKTNTEGVFGVIAIRLAATEGYVYLHEFLSFSSLWPAMMKKWNSNDVVEEKTATSIISGLEGPVVLKHSPIGMVVPGALSSAGLYSVNIPCYESWGFKGGENTPMTLEESSKISRTLIHLCSGKNGFSEWISRGQGKQAVKMGRVVTRTTNGVLVCWGDLRGIPVVFDPLGVRDPVFLDSGINEILKGIRTGNLTILPDPEKVIHFLFLSSRSKGRISIESYWKKTCGEIAKNVVKWNENISLVSNPRGMPFWKAALIANGKFGKDKADETTLLDQRRLCNNIFYGLDPHSSLINKVFRVAIAQFGRGNQDNAIDACRLMKGLMIFEGYEFNKGEMTMKEESVAFKFGRVLEKVDSGEYQFYYRKDKKNGTLGKKARQSKTKKDMLSQCLYNPKDASVKLYKKISAYDCEGFITSEINLHDIFQALPVTFSKKEQQEFVCGILAEIIDRGIRIKRYQADKKAKGLKVSINHDAGKSSLDLKDSTDEEEFEVPSEFAT
jgi:hypothetical protein